MITVPCDITYNHVFSILFSYNCFRICVRINQKVFHHVISLIDVIGDGVFDSVSWYSAIKLLSPILQQLHPISITFFSPFCYSVGEGIFYKRARLFIKFNSNKIRKMFLFDPHKRSQPFYLSIFKIQHKVRKRSCCIVLVWVMSPHSYIIKEPLGRIHKVLLH